MGNFLSGKKGALGGKGRVITLLTNESILSVNNDFQGHGLGGGTTTKPRPGTTAVAVENGRG